METFSVVCGLIIALVAVTDEQILPEPLMQYDNHNTVCYGPGTHGQFRPYCSNNDSIIAVQNVKVGTKPKYTDCPSSVTKWTDHTGTYLVDHSNISKPLNESVCCFPDESKDCISVYDYTHSGLEYKYHISSSGYTESEPDMEVSWIETKCNMSEYPGGTNFMFMEYSCIERRNIGSMCSNRTFKTTGNTFYLNNDGYPSSIKESVDVCTCEIQSGTENLQFYSIDMRLEKYGNECRQTLNLTDSFGSTIWDCDSALNFNVTNITKSNPLSVSFKNDLPVDRGNIWIGISDDRSDTLTVKCTYHLKEGTVHSSTSVQSIDSTQASTTSKYKSTTGTVHSSETNSNLPAVSTRGASYTEDDSTISTIETTSVTSSTISSQEHYSFVPNITTTSAKRDDDLTKETIPVGHDSTTFTSKTTSKGPDSTISTSKTTSPEPDSTKLTNKTASAEPDSTMLTSKTASQGPDSTISTSKTTLPGPDSTMLTSKTASPEPDSTMLTSKTASPGPDSTLSTSKTTLPGPDSTMLTIKTTSPEPDTTMLTNKTTLPGPDSTMLTSKTTSSEPDSTMLTSKTTLLGPDSTMLTSKTTSLEPDSTKLTNKPTSSGHDSTMSTSKTSLLGHDSTMFTRKTTSSKAHDLSTVSISPTSNSQIASQHTTPYAELSNSIQEIVVKVSEQPWPVIIGVVVFCGFVFMAVTVIVALKKRCNPRKTDEENNYGNRQNGGEDSNKRNDAGNKVKTNTHNDTVGILKESNGRKHEHVNLKSIHEQKIENRHSDDTILKRVPYNRTETLNHENQKDDDDTVRDLSVRGRDNDAQENEGDGNEERQRQAMKESIKSKDEPHGLKSRSKSKPKTKRKKAKNRLRKRNKTKIVPVLNDQVDKCLQELFGSNYGGKRPIQISNFVINSNNNNRSSNFKN